jgi:hypothetical protein
MLSPGLHNIADRGTIGPRKFYVKLKSLKRKKSKEEERKEKQKGRK